MKIIDGLVFIPERTGSSGFHVRLQCAAENGKSVGYAMRRSGEMTEQRVDDVIAELIEWFEKHTRPNVANLKTLNHPDRFKKPYKPAGYLRRMTDEELAPYTARAG